MVEQTAIDERQEHKERIMLEDISKHFPKEIEEEDEARALIEETQRNFDEVQGRASETERKLGRVLGEYTYCMKWCARTTSWARCGR